jgi:hypothetical protein
MSHTSWGSTSRNSLPWTPSLTTETRVLRATKILADDSIMHLYYGAPDLIQRVRTTYGYVATPVRVNNPNQLAENLRRLSISSDASDI